MVWAAGTPNGKRCRKSACSRAERSRRRLRVLGGLQIHEDRMAENIEETRGLIFSEAVAMVLRKKLGRSQSHQLLEDASRRAVEQNQSLQDVLLNDAKVREHLSAEEIARLMDPKNYIGSAKEMARKVLSSLDRKL